MPDKTILPENMRKGRLLELLISRHLANIVTSLRENKVKCLYIYFEDEGGKGRSGPDFFLSIEDYWFFIESKNYSERSISYADIKEKVLNKFKFNLDLSGYVVHKLLIGHYPITGKNRSILQSERIDYLDTGELPVESIASYARVYDEQLRGFLLQYIVQKTENRFYGQYSRLELCVINNNELEINDGSQTIKKININDVLGKYVVFEDRKLLDFFHINKTQAGRIMIETPLKVTTKPPLRVHTSRMGKIMKQTKCMIMSERSLIRQNDMVACLLT